MAVTWGAAVGASSGGQMKLGYQFRQSPATVLNGTTSVTVYCDIYVWTKWSVSDTSNSLVTTGISSSGAESIDTTSNTSWATANQKLLRTVSRVFTPAYGATTATTVGASLSGVDAVGAYTATVSGSHSTAARPYAVPTAPSGVAATRVSDTQQSVSWTNNSSAAGLYQSQVVMRADNVTGAGVYYDIATVAGNATSYADTTTQSDRRYTYQVRAVNTSGSATSAASASISTTPAAPAGLVATKSVGDVVLTWEDASSAEDGFDIYESQGGGAYASLASVAAGVATYTHVAPSSAVTHTYQVRSKTTTPALYSAWATSNTVQMLTAPAAPIPSVPVAFDATAALVLAWAHQPIDGTAQTWYQYRYRVVGAPSWTTPAGVTSPTSSATLAAGTLVNGNTYEFQFATKGQHADASPWSTSAVAVASAAPTATIQSPAASAVVTVPSITVEWAYYDAEATAQSAYRVALYSAADVLLWSAEYSGSATSADVPVTLANATSYKVGVTVRDGDGLWGAQDIHSFDVAYAPPETPSCELTYDEPAAAVAIQITNPAGAGPEAISNRVYRVIDGIAELVAADVAPNGSVIDPIPATGATTGYYVEAWSATPSVATSAPVDLVLAPDGRLHWNWGPGLANHACLADNVSFDTDATPEQSYFTFAGRTHPVLFTGESVEVSMSASGDCLDDPDMEAAFEALARYGAAAFHRDCRGHRVHVGVKCRLSEGAGPRITRCAVEMRQVDA